MPVRSLTSEERNAELARRASAGSLEQVASEFVDAVRSGAVNAPDWLERFEQALAAAPSVAPGPARRWGP